MDWGAVGKWFSDAVIGLLCFLNRCVFGLVRTLLQTFMDISNVTLFTPETIQDFLDRVYVILGIYMLFKLAVSLLMSIVNPDNLTDKERGMQKIIPRTVMALAMLVMVPTVFDKVLGWQNSIALAVPRIIIGKNASSSTDNVGDQGEQLAATALAAFLEPNPECTSPAADTAADNLKSVNTLSAALSMPLLSCGTSGSEKNIYLYNFNGVVSIFAGIFLVVSLASYCIDIAIRVIKIGLLRLLAPIPIISYIDPKSEKQGAFGNWAKECVSTYIELFIKLGILYFVIFILSSISQNSMFGGTNTTNAFVNVFLILGAFFFMGKAADFICNILGVKKPDSSGGGFFKGLAGLAGLGLGAVSAGFTNYRGTLQSRAARGKTTTGFRARAAALSSALLGSGVGAVTGVRAATSRNGGVGNTLKAIHQRNVGYTNAAAVGSTGMGRFRANVSRAVLGETPYERLERQVNAQDNFVKQSESYQSALKSEATKGKYGSVSVSGGGSYMYDQDITGTSKSLRAQAAIAASQGLNDFYYTFGSGPAKRVSMQDYERIASDMEKAEMQNLDSQIAAGLYATDLPDLVASRNAVMSDSNARGVTTVKSLDDATKRVKAESIKTKNSREYLTGKANTNATRN